jgi:spore coat protein U-like protein
MMMNKMILRQKLLGAAAVFVMLSVTQANAQQTADLAVTAEVPEACVIDSAAVIPMAFGILDVVVGGAGPGGDTLQSANFDWRCSEGTAVTIGLNLGVGAGATLAKRVMTGTNTGDTLPYRLQKTDGSDWSDVLGTTPFTAVAAGFGTPDSVQIDGIITLADSQTAEVDTYTDTVTITLLP